ncbi:metallophosphoesterase family protein [Persicobacter psychrovividus]|uniref:Calcineurin-like phosphoesterase domain-containing protein n=1 Tax=Persicobacter psychrovividus TaxID=387638 RepID=A0ABN6LG15_9BACT|nr:hypothetical protein PEPS_43100 [Persicobacter psychrovividus]
MKHHFLCYPILLLTLLACSKSEISRAVSTDRTALQTTIMEAHELLDNATEGTKEGYYEIGAKADLEEVVQSSEAVMSDVIAEQQAIDASTETLKKAVEVFKSRKIPEGTTPSNGKVRFVLQGDTQKIVNQAPDNYLKTMDAVLKDSKLGDVVCYLQMGDLTEDGQESNWKIVQQGWNKFDDFAPYVLNVGNNDLMNGGESKFNQYFPLSKFEKWDSFVSNYDQHTNVAHQFSAGGVKWLIISVRFERSNAVKQWTENLIKENPDKNVILIRHDANADGSDAVMSRKYDNVVLVCCGHTESSHQLQQHNSGSSLGWVKVCHHNKDRDDYFCILDIDVDAGEMSMRYYSPLKESYGDHLTHEVTGHYGKPVKWKGFEFVGKAN